MEYLKKDCVVIGGGIAGLACGKELGRLGLESVVVEKAPFLGGHVARYCCKATDQCRRCGACVLEEVMSDVRASERVSCLVRTELIRTERRNGTFQLTLLQRPSRIHLDRCTDCGACLEACTAPGALVRSPLDKRISLKEDACLFFKDGSCRLCAEVCPEAAVDLASTPGELLIEASSMVLACGFKAFDPHDKPRFGYGRIPGVITSLELDSMLRTGSFAVGDGHRRIETVAFIQCVGSRDVKIGHNYCSRICCGQALRLASVLRSRFEGIEPTVFYMDIQTFDRDFDRRLSEMKREVRLVRAIPAEVRTGPAGSPELIYQGPGDERIIESFDLVVLSVGIAPDQSALELGKLLGLSTNEDGFLRRTSLETAGDSRGLFVSGTVEGPKSIRESISDAVRTAGEILSYLSELRR